MAAKPLTFLTPTYIESRVGDETLKFYPISVQTAFSLRSIAKPLFSAIMTLFAGVGRESSEVKKVSQNGDNFEREDITSAIDPKLASLKIESRNKAINDFVDALCDEKNAEVVGRLVMDSLRDDCPRVPRPDKKAVEAFLADADIVRMRELLVGVAEANKDVFGPFKARLVEMANSPGNPFAQAVASDPLESPSPPSPSPELTTT